MKTLFKFGIAALVALGGVLAGCNSGTKDASTAASTTATTTGSTPDATTAQAGGQITIDGSSTVFPIANAMGEDFKKAQGTNVVVNKSGTGSGMQKFLRGEIDIASASRPITPAEDAALKKAGMDYLEIPVAYDGVCIVVNTANTWVKKLTPADLMKGWNSKSTVKTWADWSAGWPASKINFYGPSENHGTYEYFTEAADKKKGDIRKDYQSNQDYNVVVQSVAGDKDGIGYMGFNYYAENKDKVKIVPIDSGKGPVEPSEKTIIDGSYSPFSRPLFMYVSKKSYDRPEVKKFVDYVLGADGAAAVKEAKYVALAADVVSAVSARISAGKTGSLFMNVTPGTPVSQVLTKETAGK